MIDEILRRLERLQEDEKPLRVRPTVSTLTREQALAAIAKHKQIARDMAYNPKRHQLLIDVDMVDCLGFVEVCTLDMHINGLLFEVRPNDRYMPLVFGGLASRVAWQEFHQSILDLHSQHTEEAADEE